jgi:transposase InsO family protein
VGPLLAAPPEPGLLAAEFEKLTLKKWTHPVSGELVHFKFSTIERWYYQALNASDDPVGALRRKVRKDAGQHPSMGAPLVSALHEQYRGHKNWSMKLHADNLRALARKAPGLGVVPEDSTLRRFLRTHGMVRQRRLGPSGSAGAQRAEQRLEEREVRSFEATHVHALWHLDFHHSSLKAVLPSGEWVIPVLLGILDDRSRLCCHMQWYLAENAENLCHGMGQALQKRGRPRKLFTDNGSAMLAHETRLGLHALSILHDTTLPHSPYQNAKVEVFWAQVEGRLMKMLQNEPALTLRLLNEATQAWVEMEYNRKVHSETGQTPLARMLAGPDVSRSCPQSAQLRQSFCTHEVRTVRRSDGTVSIGGVRFEIPNAYRHFLRVDVRFASWDLSVAYLCDERLNKVLCSLNPVDKAGNADGIRRTLQAPAGGPNNDVEKPPPGGIAPLLVELMAQYAATGMPPAYLPKDDIASDADGGEKER